MKTLQSRVCRATSFNSEIRRGASSELNRARYALKMLMANRRRFRFGWARRLLGLRSYLYRYPDCAKKWASESRLNRSHLKRLVKVNLKRRSLCSKVQSDG